MMAEGTYSIKMLKLLPQKYINTIAVIKGSVSPLLLRAKEKECRDI